MHIQTHTLSGWCCGNLFGLQKRGRSLAIVVSVFPDLDGLGIIFGPVVYWKYHHLICHNLLFGLCMSAGLAWFCEKKGKAFWVFLLLFHLHMVMDSFGSGEDWTICYFWPFWDWEFDNPYRWAFYSWQNLSAGGLFIVWTLLLIFTKRRTFFEWIMPNLDRQIVEIAEKAKKSLLRSKSVERKKSGECSRADSE